jgi:hypothetical protein
MGLRATGWLRLLEPTVVVYGSAFDLHVPMDG